MIKRLLAAGLLLALLCCILPAASIASTTGSLRGRVTDAANGSPIAGATVTATSPSQFATTLTDQSGSFSFLSLAPDTYTVRVEFKGYDSASQPGYSIYADQSTQANVAMNKTLQTIAHVGARSSSSLLHPGTTSDVYSVNAAGQRAAMSVAGAGSLNQAYGAIASVPGTQVPANQQGWYQQVYIRGGDSDQVAFEFDGVPVVRQSDLAPIVTESSLGQQEVQVYTGGTPATSDASGIAGYINQVIKTGTSPGYATSEIGIGGPAFYHKFSIEAGGSTPDRLFSYYVGLAGANQSYRYLDQYNGVSDPNYYYPLNISTGNAVYNQIDGSCAIAAPPACSGPNYGAQFSPGASYAQSYNEDREDVINFHIGVPHRDNPLLRDDIQLLYVTGNIFTDFYSSANDIGSGQVALLDTLDYDGPLMQTPNAANLAVGPFPSSSSHVAFDQNVPVNEEDASSNGFAILKAQYQHNINDRSYWRILGYSEYTDWFINAPTSAELTYGAELADYEVLGHIFGGNFAYSNQLSSKNQITFTTAVTTQRLQTYNATFQSPGSDPSTETGLGSLITSYVGKNGNCYDYTTGLQASCFALNSQGGGSALLNDPSLSPANRPGQQAILEPGFAPAGTPAAAAGARWLVTENGQSAQVDDVTPYFSSAALMDTYQPNDRILINFGARIDGYHYVLDNLENNYPARAFWFNAYNNEYCGDPGSGQAPVQRAPGGPCPTGFQAMANAAGVATPGVGLFNVGSTGLTSTVFQPRFAMTYTLNQDNVLRMSAGRYGRATATSYQQYNTFDQDLPQFISQFYGFGFNTPDHAVLPDISDNYDFSLEHRIEGTRMSFKLSPFYRDTKNQLQYDSIDALGGTLGGVNVGTQRASGVEFSFQDGDFARDGLAFSLSYTYTNDVVHFSPIPGTNTSVLDPLNAQIELYNSYTSKCAANENAAICGSGAYSYNGSQTYAGNGVANPYWNAAPQPLLSTGAGYTPYDVIPSPFNAANGYATPNVATLIVNYRRKKLAITPTLTYNSGSFYGSPVSWGGYVPQSCAQSPALTPQTPGASCSGSFTGPGGVTESPGDIFLPDPYTGKFDSLGALRQPTQLTGNLQLTYDINPRMSVTVVGMNILNHCYQRGYAWDDANVCIYSNLPSNILPPDGNYLQTNAAGIPVTGPKQLQYPYGPWFDITEVGYSAVKQPFSFAVNLDIKL